MNAGAQDIEIRSVSRSFQRVFSEPLTWLPYLPVVAAYSFLDAPGWMALGAFGAVTVMIGAWWRTKWNALREENRVEVLREVCRADNAEIEKSLLALMQDVAHEPFRKTALGQLRDLPRKKEAIDEAIFADGRVSSVETEIAMMVSDLCRALLVDLRKMADPNATAKERDRLADSVTTALNTLDRTHTEIETLLEPLRGLETPADTVAQERASRLEERMAEARAIRQRLARDMGETTTEAPPKIKQE